MNLTWYRSIMGDPQHGRTKSGHIAVLVPASQWVEHHAFCPTVNFLKAGSGLHSLCCLSVYLVHGWC